MGMWKSNGGLDGRARVSRGECINHELDHNTLSVCVCVCVCVRESNDGLDGRARVSRGGNVSITSCLGRTSSIWRPSAAA